ncbi:MAG: ATP-binding cassette domain-containing protein [Planctomycetes bacterium]|nr:ATP-binding cassette domain-containing protein [Planctomycetota bacterium]
MTPPVAEAVDLTCRLGGRAALDAVSLAVEPRGRLAVLGRSGAGKTTLLRAFAGLVAPAAGQVRLGGALASDGPRLLLPPEARGVGLVFQQLALWPHLGVEATIAFAARGSRAERRARARALAARVGLGDRLEARPDELSGGEQQRLALARALAPAPSLLLLDEPFAHLDPALRADLVALLLDLQADAGVALLLVSHQRRDVFDLARRAVVLDAGRAVEAGDVADLVQRPRRAETVALLDLGAVVPGRLAPGGLETPLGLLEAAPGTTAQAALVRPEQVRLDASGVDGVAGVVRRTVVLDGTRLAALVRVGDLDLRAVVPAPLPEGAPVRVSVEGPCALLEG